MPFPKKKKKKNPRFPTATDSSLHEKHIKYCFEVVYPDHANSSPPSLTLPAQKGAGPRKQEAFCTGSFGCACACRCRRANPGRRDRLLVYGYGPPCCGCGCGGGSDSGERRGVRTKTISSGRGRRRRRRRGGCGRGQGDAAGGDGVHEGASVGGAVEHRGRRRAGRRAASGANGLVARCLHTEAAVAIIAHRTHRKWRCLDTQESQQSKINKETARSLPVLCCVF